MDYKELSKQEYTARINRVMDYIGQNIDKTIDLSMMADRKWLSTRGWLYLRAVSQ